MIRRKCNWKRNKVIGSPAAGIGFALTEDNAFLKGASLLAPEILGTKGIVSKILNPFNVGRVMTPVGLPVTIGGNMKWQKEQNQIFS